MKSKAINQTEEGRNFPEHYSKVHETRDQLLSAIAELCTFSQPHLIGRAGYQVRRELAGVGRVEGRGPADPNEEQILEDHESGLTYQWYCTPAKNVRSEPYTSSLLPP